MQTEHRRRARIPCLNSPSVLRPPHDDAFLHDCMNWPHDRRPKAIARRPFALRKRPHGYSCAARTPLTARETTVAPARDFPTCQGHARTRASPCLHPSEVFSLLGTMVPSVLARDAPTIPDAADSVAVWHAATSAGPVSPAPEVTVVSVAHVRGQLLDGARERRGAPALAEALARRAPEGFQQRAGGGLRRRARARAGRVSARARMRARACVAAGRQKRTLSPRTMYQKLTKGDVFSPLGPLCVCLCTRQPRGAQYE